jgi:hypothetical protein
MEPHAERARRDYLTLDAGDCVPLELWIGGEKIDVRIDASGIHFGAGEPSVLLRWSDALGLAVLRSSRAGPEAA